jgi:hypothetical protein
MMWQNAIPYSRTVYEDSVTIRTGVEEIQLGYLEVTVLRRGVGEVLVVVGRAPAC